MDTPMDVVAVMVAVTLWPFWWTNGDARGAAPVAASGLVAPMLLLYGRCENIDRQNLVLFVFNSTNR